MQWLEGSSESGYSVGVNFPIIVVNFKAYESALGAEAHALAQLHDSVNQAFHGTLAIAVSALDLSTVANLVDLPVFIQHVDPVEYGARTGHIPPAAARASGAYGTLLNHAEHRLPFDVLEKTMALCKQAGLFTIVCAESPEKVSEFLSLAPDAIAYEPPELIGGTVSVSQAQPEVIRKVVEIAGDIPLLVGAGVKTDEDTRVSLQLGAKGVLLASGVTLATDPSAVLAKLIDGMTS